MPTPGLAASNMTPEQRDEWQRAIDPLSYLDFHALSKAERQAAGARLRSRGAPDWAVALRENIVSAGWARHEGWVPDFALRAEAALVGLQLLYPGKHDAGPVYRRLRLRFVHRALEPFVEYAEGLEAQGKTIRLIGYVPLVSLYRVTEFTDVPPDGRALQAVLEDAKERHNVLRRYRDIAGLGEGLAAVWLALQLADKKPHGMGYAHARLDNLHRWRLGEVVREDDDEPEDCYHLDLIAPAYLAALEAECPPPDWLRVK